MVTTNYHSVIREQSGIPLEQSVEDLQAKELSEHVADISRAIHAEWLQIEPTIEFFKSISAQIDELETQARLAACAYHINNKHQEIIMLLVRAEQLRNIRQRYGIVRNSTNT